MDLLPSVTSAYGLNSLPEDAWAILVQMFEPVDILKIWTASTRHLRTKLSQCVQAFTVEYLPPPFLALSTFRLKKLTIMSFATFIDPRDLVTLPATLEELCLNFTNAQSCWLAPRPGYSELEMLDDVVETVMLSELFPNLSVLRLIGDDWNDYEYEQWGDIKIPDVAKWTNYRKKEWTRGLPKSLTVLALPVLLLDDTCLARLPNLTNLEVISQFISKQQPPPSLPATLQSLKLHAGVSWSGLVLPPHLNELDVLSSYPILDVFVSTLPKELHSLTLDCKATDLSLLLQLPSTITRLSLLGNLTRSLVASYFPRSLLELTTTSEQPWSWRDLPATLTALRVETSSFSSRLGYSDLDYPDLPRGLQTLVVSFPCFLTDASALLLPPHLKRLEMRNTPRHSSDLFMATLPISLTQLTLDRVEVNVKRLLSALKLDTTMSLHIPSVFAEVLAKRFPLMRHFSVDEWSSIIEDNASLIPNNVTSLTIIEPGGTKIDPDFVDALHDDLQSFTFKCSAARSLTFSLLHLPTHLTFLHLEGVSLPFSFAWRLPRGLLHLHTGFNCEFTLRLAGDMPPSLLTLKMPNAYGGGKKCIAQLPRSLTKLVLPRVGANQLTEGAASLFPPNLTHLDIAAGLWSKEYIAKLPKSLTHVRLGYREEMNGEPLLKIIRGQDTTIPAYHQASSSAPATSATESGRQERIRRREELKERAEKRKGQRDRKHKLLD